MGILECRHGGQTNLSHLIADNRNLLRGVARKRSLHRGKQNRTTVNAKNGSVWVSDQCLARMQNSETSRNPAWFVSYVYRCRNTPETEKRKKNVPKRDKLSAVLKLYSSKSVPIKSRVVVERLLNPGKNTEFWRRVLSCPKNEQNQ